MILRVLRVLWLMLENLVFPKWKLHYWDRRGVRNVKPEPEWNEASWMSNNVSRFAFYKKVYDKFTTEDYVGFFFRQHLKIEPKLMICSSKLIKDVLAKDFGKFSSRLRSTSKEEDPFALSIFNLDGTERWRELRRKFLPAFSTGNLGLMFEAISAQGVKLRLAVSKNMDSAGTVDVSILAQQYVMQVIASCVFGSAENIFANPNSEFVRMAKIMRRQSSTDLLPILNLRSRGTHRRDRKTALNYFRKLIQDTTESRRKNNEMKPDFLQFFVDLMDSEKSEHDQKSVEWTFEETTVHSLLFILGGYTGTAAVISFALYEIAKNPTVQEKLHDEISKSLRQSDDSRISYDILRRLPYLEKVVLETMRKYPPFAVDMRVCSEDCTLTGETGAAVIVEKGMSIVIPISGIHHDPKYYPDPLNFDPDRFEPEAVSSRPAFCYLPFGEGPRKCIGKQLGLLCVKVAVFNLLSHFQVSVSPKNYQPFEFLPKKFTTTVACVKLQFKEWMQR